MLWELTSTHQTYFAITTSRSTRAPHFSHSRASPEPRLLHLLSLFFPFPHVGPSPQQDSSPRLSSSLVAQTVKNLPAIEPAGDPGLIPGSERSPGEGNGNPLQYACLENYMDRGAWWATVHGFAESCTYRESPLEIFLDRGPNYVYFYVKLCFLECLCIQ